MCMLNSVVLVESYVLYPWTVHVKLSMCHTTMLHLLFCRNVNVANTGAYPEGEYL